MNRKQKQFRKMMIAKRQQFIDQQPEKAQALRKKRVEKFLKSLRGSDELPTGVDAPLSAKKFK